MTPVVNNRIEGQTFVGANIQIDGGTMYVKCKFLNCNLVLTGMGNVQLDATYIENCKWSFAGPASNTISFLKTMYENGNKEMVENIFRLIRSEELIVLPPHGGKAIQ